MHLLTISNPADAELVRKATQEKFPRWLISVREIHLNSILNYGLRPNRLRAPHTYDYQIDAAWQLSGKRLTIGASNTALVVMPTFAQAFYAGMMAVRKAWPCANCDQRFESQEALAEHQEHEAEYDLNVMRKS